MARGSVKSVPMMNKRDFLKAGAACGLGLQAGRARAADRWGADLGHPWGWGPAGQVPRWEAYPEYRVGNYSGGFERMFRHHVIQPGQTTSPMEPAPAALRYRWGFSSRSPQDYLDQWPVTSLLIARNGKVLYEAYRMGRQPDMRMTSWSMAKSVTSLLFGIALDLGLVRSLDDLRRCRPSPKSTCGSPWTPRARPPG